jgi:DNA-binding CsgD family transcriptional regulator
MIPLGGVVGVEVTTKVSDPILVGRERELAVIERLLVDVDEHGAALVLRGDAGIGKSALLGEARRLASERGTTVLATSGVQSEARLPFAGLHQLLQPVLGRLDRLPAPQRAAVRTAFGMTEDAAPDFFLIALAALDLLADLAATEPLLLVVEDAHWLDGATCDVLAFVARRIDFEPIVLLFAVREGAAGRVDGHELPALQLGPLDDDVAERLLDATAPDLAPELRRRVLAEALGNPLALVELPLALASSHVEPALPPNPLPLTERLERAFAARLGELPPETRIMLLLAALDVGDLPVLLNAATRLAGRELDADALAPAADASLVTIAEEGVRFRHPLVRSGVYQAASALERRDAHAALADALSGNADRRVWHRAAASRRADESIAAELDEAATRARRRGAVDTAVVALQRAAELSESDAGKARRLLSAAALAFELGRQDQVHELTQATDGLALDGLERARLLLIQELAGGRVAMNVNERVLALVEVAERARAAGDADLALNLLFGAASRCYWTELGTETRFAVLDAADRLGDLGADPRLSAILAFAAPIERGSTVIAHLNEVAVGGLADLDGPGARMLGNAAHAVGVFELAGQFYAVGVPSLRAQGRLALLGRALVLQSRSAIHLGRWSDAVALAVEGGRLADETGELLFSAAADAAQALVAAFRGDEDEAERRAAEAERVSLPRGGGAGLAAAQLARGIAALGAARHADAYERLARMFDPQDSAYHVMERAWAIGDLAEAAAYGGRRDEALAALATVEAIGARTPSPRVHVALGYARPLLADDADAERLFEASLEADLSLWPFDRARLLFAYGSWLRRRRRVAESRAHLRAALDAFEALGAAGYAERTGQELRASGETSRRRGFETREELTPQELQIAQLAAEGLTNREIGQRLYLSHRTVGSHLYRIFPKLGITARSQLRDALGSPVAS